MINRNNYEEYFLLLADKELTPAEEAMVKAFAAQHPDLQEELDIILSCRLEVEPMPVFPKEKLLRTTTWNEENPEPIHTQMLLLLDNELNATEQQQVQTKINASTALQQEWNMLQQTKLIAEAIAHPDKESLYRKERKVRPLVWMRWAAAAAIVTAIGTLVWMNDAMQQQGGQDVANNTAIQPKSTPNTTTTIQTTPANTDALKTKMKEAAEDAPANISSAAENTTPTETLVASNAPVKSVNPTTTNTTHSDQPQEKEAPLIAANTISETQPDYTTSQLHTSTAPLSSNEDVALQTAQLTPKNIALPAATGMRKDEVANNEQRTFNAEEDEYIVIGGAHIKKQKMRGLFRSVSRTVSRGFSKSKMEPDAYALVK